MLKSLWYKRINFPLKLGLGLLCLFYLYQELFIKNKFNLLWSQFLILSWDISKIILLFSVFFLVLVNWGIETGKWKFLIDSIQKVTWLEAFFAVISGITLSIFTPNRLGDFAARIFYLKRANRTKGLLISLVGSISQLSITLILGGFCLCIYIIRYENLSVSASLLVRIIPFFIAVFTLLFYFNLSILYWIVSKLKKGAIIKHLFNVFTTFSNRILTLLLMLSLFRFIIFSLQYYLILLFFDIDISWADSFIITSCIYIALAIIPTMALVELGVRGALSIYFFKPFISNELTILASSYVIWCINLFLPSLLGLLFLSKIEFFKT